MAISETGTGASNPLGDDYQVFLSFRGSDTRRGFTDTLYNALVEVGVRVFIDNEEVRLGKRSSGNLLQAIDDSRLYIPIFSPNYASSHRCLRELAKMVENTKSREDGYKKVILPIFYNVERDDVKLRTQFYSNDILNLEKKFSSKDIEMWRQALREVGGIGGLDLQNYTGDGDLSKTVVNEVVDRLKTRQREVTKDLVGMEVRIAALNNLLDIDSGGVRLIGIYGMCGMGKTTLAKNIYNQLYPYYGKSCSFLDDVRETANTKGLVNLQEQLLSNISSSRVACNIVHNYDVIKAIEEIICNKKVLIVLDDVDDGNQIRKLIGINSLYPGTRILVTTRDKRVLNIRGFKYEIVPYEMEGLSDKDALQLFSRHAFDDNSPPANYYTLSKDIVSTAGGLPFALEAIGSSLFGQEDKKLWKEVLQELKNKPHNNVLRKLRITFDTLTSGQQQIFLDVACFFIGFDKTDPIYMWKDCGFSPEYTINVLINMCMIKVLDDNSFWMHDQFRDLGRAIAKEERTMLWDRDDITCELRSTKIKRSVRALCLQAESDNPTIVTAEEIKRFPNLHFLWLGNVICKGNFTGCLSKLKWIYLSNLDHKHDRQFMATNLHLENVVAMYICGYAWTDDAVRSLIEGASKLKVLTLLERPSIHRILNFPKYSLLEKLTISKCSSLKDIDYSIGKLRWLTDLSVEYCEALEKLPEQIGELKNLQHLSLMVCRSLKELPNSVSKLESLKKLDVSLTSIARLPDSFGRLQSLSSLDVSHTNIVKLPGTMSKLSQLHTLNLYACHEIQELPELPRSLKTLRLRSSSLQTVPDLSNLTNLVELLLSDASDINKKSNIIQPRDLLWIGRLSKLRKQHLCLLNVHATSTEWGSLSLLEELTLCGLDLQTLKQLPSNLTVLELVNIQAKQTELDGLPQLEKLTIRRCELVTRISITSTLRKLREAEVSSCNKLVEVQFLGVLKSMESLSIIECESFDRLVCLSEEPGCNELQAPELIDGWRRVSLVSSSLKMLQKLQLWRCPELQEIQFVSMLESMKEFVVEECISLTRLGGLSNLKNLKRLKIEGCKSLQVVEGIDELEFLHRLEVYGCRSMKRIIDASSSKIPKECQIQMRDCGELLDTSPYGSSVTWECYREKILNAPTQASNSDIKPIFSDYETEIEDPLLERLWGTSMGNIRSKPKLIEQRRSHRTRTRASSPSQALDSDSALVSGTLAPPHQAEELEKCSDDIKCRPPENSRTVLMRKGLGLTEPPEVTKWQSFTEICLTENQLTELPKNPRCPVLLALFLNRNCKLRTISPSFFDYMPALEILNLSQTRIKSLPESLFKLSHLKRLFLNHCELLRVLPPEIGELQLLEVLELEGTEIMDLPKEVAKLTKLTCLKVSFCPRTNCGTESANANALIPQGTISALSQLEKLSIDILPEDEGWESVVEAIVDDVCGLMRLDTLKLYFPQVEHLRKWFGTSKVSRSLSHFKFIVGKHAERIMCYLPEDLEFELDHWDRSLQYVNGVGVPKDIQKMLRHTTAFFLDRHKNVTKLSDFGIENMEQLKCCIIGECHEIQVIVDGTDMYDEADRSEIVLETQEDDRRFLGSIEHLYVYRMKSVRCIYEGPLHRGSLSRLKCLALLTCPRLTTIFTLGLLENLGNLEELKVEDCPLVLSLVRCEDTCVCESTYVLPKLKKISLFSLPELTSIFNGLRIAPNLERLNIIDCPNLKSPSTDEICCNHLTGTKARSIPNDASREQPAPPVVSSPTTGNADPLTSKLKREPKVAPRLWKFKFNDVKLVARNFSAASLLGKGGFGCVRGFTNEVIVVTPQLRKFSLKDLKLATRNFSPEALLCEGGFNRVFKGWIEENGTAAAGPGTGLAVAVKTLKHDELEGHKEWLAEVSILGHLVHPNLVKLIGYCVKVNQRLLIYEFMQGGSLDNHLFKMGCAGGTPPLPWSTRMKIALDAAKGLAFLHEEAELQVIFRDFKTSEILLDADYNAKLSPGLGAAKIVPKGDDPLSTRIIGTPGYIDPEYLMTARITVKSDVYGFGVVLLEILTGRKVFDMSLPDDDRYLLKWAQPHLGGEGSLYELIDSRLGNQFSEKGAQIALQLAARCLRLDSQTRPGMSEVVEVLKAIQDLPHMASPSNIQSVKGKR